MSRALPWILVLAAAGGFVPTAATSQPPPPGLYVDGVYHSTLGGASLGPRSDGANPRGLDIGSSGNDGVAIRGRMERVESPSPGHSSTARSLWAGSTSSRSTERVRAESLYEIILMADLDGDGNPGDLQVDYSGVGGALERSRCGRRDRRHSYAPAERPDRSCLGAAPGRGYECRPRRRAHVDRHQPTRGEDLRRERLHLGLRVLRRASAIFTSATIYPSSAIASASGARTAWRSTSARRSSSPRASLRGAESSRSRIKG